MKKIAVIAMLLWVTSAYAYGKAYFTGRSEYLGGLRTMCEYSTNSGMVFTIVVDGYHCPYSTDL